MIESFFDNTGDYMKFLLRLEEMKKATPDFSCIATLKKVDENFLYTLQWKDERWIGEYVRPFRVTEENLRLFNAGCAQMARRYRIFLETGDPDSGGKEPPAFGVLSCEWPDELLPPEPQRDEKPRQSKYFPAVIDLRPVKRYETEDYNLLLATDVKSAGIIQYAYLLIAWRKDEKEPCYIVASEVNNMRMPGEDSGTHFLCCFPGEGHRNLGASDDWGNLALFEKKACQVISRELHIKL